jgi:hypothetical protein
VGAFVAPWEGLACVCTCDGMTLGGGTGAVIIIHRLSSLLLMIVTVAGSRYARALCGSCAWHQRYRLEEQGFGSSIRTRREPMEPDGMTR